MADQDRTSGQSSRGRMQDSGSSDSMSDRQGSGGYGASSGFSEGTRGSRDDLGASDSRSDRGESRDGLRGSGGSRQQSDDLRASGASGSSSRSSRSSSDASSDSEEMLPQHEQSQNHPGVGMRGRSTGRSSDEGMR